MGGPEGLDRWDARDDGGDQVPGGVDLGDVAHHQQREDVGGAAGDVQLGACEGGNEREQREKRVETRCVRPLQA